MEEPPEILPWTGLPDASYMEPSESEEADVPLTKPEMTVEDAAPFFAARYGIFDKDSPLMQELMTKLMQDLSQMPVGLTIPQVLERIK